MKTIYLALVVFLLISGTGCSPSTIIQSTDPTPPVISDVLVSDITESSVTITWTTDEPATSNAEFRSKTTVYIVEGSSPLDTSHSITLDTLRSDTTFSYKVISQDASNNESESDDYAFTTFKELAFETIEKGYVSGFRERSFRVVTNNSDWQNLWDIVNSIRTPQPPLPEIDFTETMIIAVFQGCKPTGGYSIEITKVVETESALEVYVEETSPGPWCVVTCALSEPHHIIKIPKSDKEFIFEVEQKVLTCPLYRDDLLPEIVPLVK